MASIWARLLILQLFMVHTGNTDAQSCTTVRIDDGLCDENNNNADCDYDGEDCCECDCVDGAFECGIGGFNCLTDDGCPTTTITIITTAVPTDDVTNCITPCFGDAYCDEDNNNAYCDYDGGDCCPCTCVDGANYECGFAGFNCLTDYCETATITSTTTDDATDDATDNPTDDATDYPTDNTTNCITQWIGDAYCDEDNNNADCDCDGGDCCPCTCVDGAFECGIAGFNCLAVDCDA